MDTWWSWLGRPNNLPLCFSQPWCVAVSKLTPRTSLPSISWGSIHTATSGSAADYAGKSQTPLTETALQAHADSQPPPAPLHKHTYPCNLPHLDIWEQSYLLFADYRSSPLRVPAVGKRGQRRRRMNKYQRAMGNTATRHWKPPLQHSKMTAVHCTRAGGCLHALLLCVLKRLIPIRHEHGLMINMPGRHHLPEGSPTPPALTYPEIYWFDMTGLTVQVTFLHMIILPL